MGVEEKMASNKGTVRAIERIVEIIDELNAWKKIMVFHAAQQRRQSKKVNRNWRHEYDPVSKKLIWRKVKKLKLVQS